MIARLKGTVVERQDDGLVVDCGGVGYDVTASLATLAALPDLGGEVTLRVFTHATESRIALYGFATAEERQLFDLLITVKNVGPATAIAILSGSALSPGGAAGAPQALARTIAAGDVRALTKIKGVGKKTADLLVVELREKCEVLIATWGVTAGSASMSSERGRLGSRSPLLDDVASALVNLGWRPAEADKTIARLEVTPAATIETLLRDALRAMPR